MKIGDKVRYIPYPDAPKEKIEKGIIKSEGYEDGQVFVVFHCNNEWSDYENYTGQICDKSKLKLNWND